MGCQEPPESTVSPPSSEKSLPGTDSSQRSFGVIIPLWSERGLAIDHREKGRGWGDVGTEDIDLHPLQGLKGPLRPRSAAHRPPAARPRPPREDRTARRLTGPRPVAAGRCGVPARLPRGEPEPPGQARGLAGWSRRSAGPAGRDCARSPLARSPPSRRPGHVTQNLNYPSHWTSRRQACAAGRMPGRTRLGSVMCHISTEVPRVGRPVPGHARRPDGAGQGVVDVVDRYLDGIQAVTTRASYAETLACLTAIAGSRDAGTLQPEDYAALMALGRRRGGHLEPAPVRADLLHRLGAAQRDPGHQPRPAAGAPQARPPG